MGLERHPLLPFLAAALLAPLAPRRLRPVVLLAAPLSAFWQLYRLVEHTSVQIEVLGRFLTPLYVDPLNLLFGAAFVTVALCANLYALGERSRLQHAASQAYVACALGAVFSGDIGSLLLFWEGMALTSTFVIWAQGSRESLNAGLRYLLVHAAGGAMLFAGVAMRWETGQTWFGLQALDLPGWLILGGFLVNAAMPPLHAWLPDAYPRATASGSVYLSAFTTKTAVYVLLRAFPGTEVLAVAGACMALYGVTFAMMEQDIRRLLSYHIVSQVGYMIAGVGLGTFLARDGAAAHAFSHLLYKGLLFMATGAVLQATGRSRLQDLGGLAGRMPWTFLFYMIGAFSISGVPPFNGFISKSMTLSAAGEAHAPLVEFLLVAASVGTFLSVGLKLPAFTFLGPAKRGGETPHEASFHQLAAMALAAGLCTLFGVWPDLLYRYLPNHSHYHPYSASHILQSLQLLMWTGLGFLTFKELLKPKTTLTLDADWFYRVWVARAVRALGGALKRLDEASQAGLAAVAAAGAKRLREDRSGTPVGWHVNLVLIALLLSVLLLQP